MCVHHVCGCILYTSKRWWVQIALKPFEAATWAIAAHKLGHGFDKYVRTLDQSSCVLHESSLTAQIECGIHSGPVKQPLKLCVHCVRSFPISFFGLEQQFT